MDELVEQDNERKSWVKKQNSKKEFEKNEQAGAKMHRLKMQGHTGYGTYLQVRGGPGPFSAAHRSPVNITNCSQSFRAPQ